MADGFIEVHLGPEALKISNSGRPLSGNEARFFERFQKHDAASASPGLGLSIAEQIGRYYGFRVRYTFGPTGCVHLLLQVAFAGGAPGGLHGVVALGA